MKINYERIKYSPFGKEILEGFRIILIPVLIVIPLVFFISLVCFSVSWILGLITIPFVIGLPILNFSPLKETLLKALLLSLMTEEEHETLIAEYKKHKDENNIIRGQLTSYGILLSDGNSRAIKVGKEDLRRLSVPDRISVGGAFYKALFVFDLYGVGCLDCGGCRIVFIRLGADL